MRIFVLAIILAIGFSGFSAASHAIMLDDCKSSTQVQADECAPDLKNTNDHGQKHEKSGKGFCLDCAHCCVASVVLPSDGMIVMPQPSSDMNSTVRQFQPEDRLFSLLRPPKFIA